jgi:adenylosuccinate lyase
MTPENIERKVPPTFKAGFETYLSPFTFRYGSDSMRKTWSQQRFWGNVRKIWVTAAEVQAEAGLVSKEQLDDLKAHQGDLSVEEIFRLERDPKDGTGHDVAAAIKEYSEVAPLGGEKLHQGFTSEDVLSNAEIMQIHESFDILKPKLVGTLRAFGKQIKTHKDLACIGTTHLQVAEPTTMGYRFAKYAQDLLADLELLDYVKGTIKGKGIKGAVGTSASFEELLGGTGMTSEEHENKIMEKLGIDPVQISDQTYPRKFLFSTEGVLTQIAQTLHHFFLNIQVLQSSFIDEVSEPRRKGQIGSSAMPHKQNPINSENICSLTEDMPGKLLSAWITAAFVTGERTLRDSAGKRSWLPESFLIIDEVLTRAEKVINGLEVHKNSVKTNLNKFAPYSVTEIILTKLCNAGMDRKEGHEILLSNAEKAISSVRSGEPNPMKNLVMNDARVTSLLGKEEVESSFNEILNHIGDASKKCGSFLTKLEKVTGPIEL